MEVNKINYYEELNEQLSLLKNNEKMKVNIHYIISDKLNKFCVDINQKINKDNIGLISMGDEYITVPHISLFIGYVDSYDMLNNILSILEDYSKRAMSFSLLPNDIYVKSLTPESDKYIFIDFQNGEFLLKQKNDLYEKIKNNVIPNSWDMLNEPAHITIGCYKDITSKINDNLKQIKSIPSVKISQIGISVCGKKGVCLGELKIYQLRGKNQYFEK